MAKKKRKAPTGRQYKFRRGNTVGGVEAQTVGEELERIEARDGAITKRALVDDSRPRQAPCHPCFEWDDPKAADEWRLHQAAQLISIVEVVPPGKDEADHDEREIAFVSVSREDTGARGYVSTELALNDEEMKQQVLGEAYEHLQGWKRRYARLLSQADMEALAAQVFGLELAVA